uniref:Uncharacterized protein n=1 Tax=Ochrobactrum phage ORM_20 TaxID=2985243 RepID=A0A9N6ZHR0_9VIRU|nr:hypothetical protein ORM20_00181 [Ochrobactrum phage ORM_20]
MTGIYRMEPNRFKEVANKEWHVRHDDEIWTDDDEYIATADNTDLAELIVNLHNDQLDIV